MSYILFFLYSYLFGGIPFGYILARIFKKIDIRECGSGNIGATNVIRVCGKGIGIPAFILDIAKGFFPAYIGATYVDINIGISAGLGAIVGHIFTPYLKGKGGKGVATGLGVFIALAPIPVSIAFGVFLIVLFASRYVSLASMSAAVVLPVAIGIIKRDSLSLVIFGVAGCLLIIFTHRTNIKRLIKGEEHKWR